MVIDGDWIKARLTGKRGEKARLAEALGVTSDVVSKVLSGTRQLSVSEAEAAKAFFGEKPLSDEEEDLLARFRAAPAQVQEMVQAFLKLQLASGANDQSDQARVDEQRK